MKELQVLLLGTGEHAGALLVPLLQKELQKELQVLLLGTGEHACALL